MCTNALNCTRSPLIDGAELLRSTGQILQRVKHGAVQQAPFTKAQPRFVAIGIQRTFF